MPDVVACAEGLNSRPPSEDGVVEEIAVVGFHVTVWVSSAAVDGPAGAVDAAVADALADFDADGVAEVDRDTAGVGAGAAGAAWDGAAGAGCGGTAAPVAELLGLTAVPPGEALAVALAAETLTVTVIDCPMYCPPESLSAVSMQ